MKWHFSARKVDGIDPQFERFCEYADSVFYAGWQETGGCLDSLQAYGRSLKQTYAWLKRLNSSLCFSAVPGGMGECCGFAGDEK